MQILLSATFAVAVLVVTEASTSGMTYSRVFQTAPSIFRGRVASMHTAINQYSFVWQSKLLVHANITLPTFYYGTKDVGVSIFFLVPKGLVASLIRPKHVFSVA